jgi:tubulin monoglycylase TTLL3/8
MRHRTKSFEIFGYDFLIDLNYNTWLIEVNSSPTLEHSTSVTSNLVNHLVEDTLKVVLENPYKKNKTNAGYFNLIYP